MVCTRLPFAMPPVPHMGLGDKKVSNEDASRQARLFSVYEFFKDYKDVKRIGVTEKGKKPKLLHARDLQRR